MIDGLCEPRGIFYGNYLKDMFWTRYEKEWRINNDLSIIFLNVLEHLGQVIHAVHIGALVECLS